MTTKNNTAKAIIFITTVIISKAFGGDFGARGGGNSGGCSGNSGNTAQGYCSVLLSFSLQLSCLRAHHISSPIPFRTALSIRVEVVLVGPMGHLWVIKGEQD